MYINVFLFYSHKFFDVSLEIHPLICLAFSNHRYHFQCYVHGGPYNGRFIWVLVAYSFQPYLAVHSKNAVSAYFKSKQILPFGVARQYYNCADLVARFARLTLSIKSRSRVHPSAFNHGTITEWWRDDPGVQWLTPLDLSITLV